jgi:hypothetical protein
VNAQAFPAVDYERCTEAAHQRNDAKDEQPTSIKLKGGAEASGGDLNQVTRFPLKPYHP